MNRPVEKTITVVFASALVISVLLTVLIFLFMAISGLPLLREGLFLELLSSVWDPYNRLFGIRPMIWGTLFIAGAAVALAFPFSLGCAVFGVLVAPYRIRRAFRVMVKMMTGIPTVVYGFVGVFVLVPVIREQFAAGSGFCVLSAALMLAVLISPTMIIVFTDSLESVPRPFSQAADALGARPVQKLVHIMFPFAWRGILAGFILGIGRAVGDTMIALMLAGNAVIAPHTVLDSARTLTSHIALVMAANFDSPEFKSIFVCGVILYLFTALLTLSVRRLGAYREKG